MKKKLALKEDKEFCLKLKHFEEFNAVSCDRDAIRKNLQTLTISADNAMRKCVDWMNLTNDPEELHQIMGMQNDLQSFFERTRASALRRLERLEEQEQKKSNPSQGSRTTKYSQRKSSVATI